MGHPSFPQSPTFGSSKQSNARTQLPTPQIDNKVIHHLIQPSLRDAATQEEYFTYLQEKFDWEIQQIQDIHWPSVNRAMQWLDKLTRRIISKIIHEWLLLETRYHICSTSTLQHCPSCHQQAELLTISSGVHTPPANNYGKISSIKYNGSQ